MRRFLFLLVCVGLAAGGAWWWFNVRAPAAAQAAAGRRGPDSIPVLVAAATSRDVPIYLDGLGTVQASAMVTVKPQIDGKLMEVDFTEGQDVKAGDVLARIDPRTFQAALDQAVAKKAQDQSLLANARVDAARYQKLAATAYTSAQQADTQKALVTQLEAVVLQDQAQIDNARTQLSYTTIASPVAGRVGIRQVDAGNIVHASDTSGLVVVTTLLADFGGVHPAAAESCRRWRRQWRPAPRRCWRCRRRPAESSRRRRNRAAAPPIRRVPARRRSTVAR